MPGDRSQERDVWRLGAAHLGRLASFPGVPKADEHPGTIPPAIIDGVPTTFSQPPGFGSFAIMSRIFAARSDMANGLAITAIPVPIRTFPERMGSA